MASKKGRSRASSTIFHPSPWAKCDFWTNLLTKASIRGKVRITKMGGGLIRGKLFMCSFSAKKMNAACQALFDRLVAKGKNKHLALIAVCNKLLKQAFAIVKSGVPYQADFNSKLTLTL